MRPPPKKLNGADVLLWASIDQTVTPTSFCTLSDNGESVAGLAVCACDDPMLRYRLFRCDESWRVLADTRHDTIELAQREAEAEYAGTSALWRARA
jgi:hypothetical protein